MILPINDKWRLSADRYGWAIQKKKPRKAREDEWTAIRWYTSLRNAVAGLVELDLVTSDASTLAEALERVRNIENDVFHALTPAYHIEKRA